jgi:exonuclease SbcC
LFAPIEPVAGFTPASILPVSFFDYVKIKLVNCCQKWDFSTVIPIRLTLRNFMCYRESSTLDFASIHTACISGSNGNGKSALIDAITWALWGETRASLEDDLIHAGQSEAQVDFEFEVERQRFRVMRRRTKAKSSKTPGKTILELQSISGEGSRPLTADSVAQTENKIKNILHMDYPTFINSAFIRQGHANEFSTKRPGERKQVLADILQLSTYEELKEIAREEVRRGETAIQQFEAELGGLRAELAEKADCLIRLAEAQTELLLSEKASAEAKARVEHLRRQQVELDNQNRQLADLEKRLQAAQKDLRLWQEQVDRHRQHLAEYRSVQAARLQVEDNYKKLLDARRDCRECDQKSRQFRILEQSKNRLEREIERANDALNSEHDGVAASLAEAQELADRLTDWQKQLARAEEQLRSWLSEEDSLAKKRVEARLLLDDIQQLKAEKDRLGAEEEETAEKLHLLSHQAGAKCPLCETELSPEGQKRIEVKYQKALASAEQSAQTNRRELLQKVKRADLLEQEIASLETKIREGKSAAQNAVWERTKAISQAKEAQQKALGFAARLAEIEQKMASHDYALVEQTRLREVEIETAMLAYDPARHELLALRLTEMEGFAAPKQRLDEADRLVQGELEAEARAAEALEELATRLKEDGAQKESLALALQDLPQVNARLLSTQDELRGLLSREKALGERVGGLKARIERLVELEARQQQKQTQLAQAQKEEKIYRDLVQAYGKEGVQAMLIEIALPEIENEANKLLGLMTDGRMHLKLESQKPTQRGEVVETLDINISDELGTRSYEMFSGGEAFRIDFALRIALSRLLAHRAGAALSTLIIDEGFGTQDSTGIEKIKEAITSIQDSFEKILVITHIPDFKDAFPARIEVVKTAEGSMLYLN